uniref:Uncharacterized protein n=1 Tax=Culex tarsalis TaxID=7177 RepID=A0A1Q3F116_CULTA
MSLVAYDYSSDEGSDQEEDEESAPSAVIVPIAKPTPNNVNKPQQNGTPEEATEKDDPIEDEDEVHLPLPAPKKIANGLNVEEEEDDEFLRKKAIPEEVLKPPPKLPLPKVRNGKVQITIPSLRDFKDDDDKPKAKPIIGAELPKKGTGLLGMLPRPKSEMAFTVPAAQAGPSTAPAAPSKPIVNRLIPDSVANRPRNVYAEQKTAAKKPPPKKVASKAAAESDDSDDEKVDFFSLNKDDSLPEISANEINAMVAKRAARMAETVKRFDTPEEQEPQPGTSGHYSQMAPIPEEQPEEDLTNERALASLIGGNKAKRARLEEVNIIDISSADIVPTKEDFLRRKLQEETGFVPTGHLTGDWSCTSKRKSHITYLASKAADNAQELEAMWSANRQSRRQTQSKYGF